MRTRTRLAALAVVLLASLHISSRVGATDLSDKAAKLKSGMTRPEAIALLGPATWAILPTDKGEDALPDASIALLLAWKNPGCNPVRIQFNRQMRVSGWDEGRAVCTKNAYLLEFPDQFLCSRPERRAKCT